MKLDEETLNINNQAMEDSFLASTYFRLLDKQILSKFVYIKFCVWNNFWIETDPLPASLAVKLSHIVPWQLKNGWENNSYLIRNMNFMISHIFREGNHCANKLINLELVVVNLTQGRFPS